MDPKKHLKVFIEDANTGDRMCGCGCGQVVEERIATNQFFELTEDQKKSSTLVPSRTGAQNVRMTHDYGLTSDLKGNTDYTGKKLPQKTIFQFYNLNKWQKNIRVQNPKERRLANYLECLRVISNKMQLSKPVENEAEYRLRKIAQHAKGKRVDRLVVSLCYQICKSKGIPKTMGEFEEKTGIKKREIMNYSQYLQLKGFFEANEQISYLSYLNKVVQDIDIPKRMVSSITQILTMPEIIKEFGGRNPIGIVGGVIWLVIKEQKSNRYEGTLQKEIANSLSITEVTIRNVARELVPILKEAIKNYGN